MNQLECLCMKINALAKKINLQKGSISFKVGTTTTLPVGSPATVNNVGTGDNIILDFGIPKGSDGATPVNIVDNGINPETGGHAYSLVFSDGSSHPFEAPKGDDGEIPILVLGTTTTLQPEQPATAVLVDLGNNEYLYNFGIPKGTAGGSTSDLTNVHVWMETTAAVVTIPPSKDIFGIGTPKKLGYYSVLGSNITDFTTAGAAIKVNSKGTYLVTYLFVVKDTKCTVCVRRKGACVEGGHLQISNPEGNILVSGAMVYIVSLEDIDTFNGAFSLANEDNTRPMPIDPKSFSWTITQLNKTYDPMFKKIPFN